MTRAQQSILGLSLSVLMVVSVVAPVAGAAALDTGTTPDASASAAGGGGTTAAAPDLTVTNVTMDPRRVDLGEEATLSATVKNAGNATVTNRSIDVEFSIGGEEVEFVFWTTTLAPGGTATLRRNVTVDTAGSNLTATADTLHRVAESNETNNSLTVAIPPVGGPDLTVSDVALRRTNYTPGEPVTVAVNVTNVGTVPITDRSIDVDLVATSDTGGSTSDSAFVRTDLGIGETATVPVEWAAQGGNITLTVEASGVRYELNESNNTARLNLSYVDPPDLVVADVSWPSNYTAGETITLTATVRNEGPGGLNGTVTTDFYYNDTRFIRSNVTAVDLPAGTEADVTVPWSGAQAGDFSLGATVDFGNAARGFGDVNEENESNNERSEAVSRPAPDLTVADLSWPRNYSAGETITLTATVRNEGPGGFNGTFLTNFYYEDTKTIGTNFTVTDLPAGTATNVTVRWFDAQTGDFDFRVVVDEFDSINEADEANNELVVPSTATGPQPDLTVTNLTWRPREYAAGEDVTLAATVENVGIGTLNGSMHTAFYVDDVRIVTPLDFVRIDPGGRTTVEGSWNDALAGDHRLRAVVDPDDRIVEVNESNNERAAPVSRPRADLVVADVSWPSVGSIRFGEEIPLTATVRNDGGDLARCFETEVRVNGTGVGQREQCGLDTGAAVDVPVGWHAESGEHVLEAVTDVDNAAHEANESNNDRTETLTLALVPPDLTVTDVRTSPSDPVDGQAVAVSANVSNLGPGPVADRSIPVRLSVDGARTDRDEILAGLAAGESATVSFEWTASRGNHTLGVTADPGDRIGETDETNNAAAVAREYRFRRPDLIIDDVRLADPTPAVGQRTRVYANVSNLGAATRRCVEVAFTANGESLGTVGQVVACGIRANETLVSFHPWFAEAGTNDLGAEVDPTDAVPETGEANNTAAARVDVEHPDLAVTDVEVSPGSGIQPGDEVRISAEVTNVGGGGVSGPVDLRVELRNGSGGTVIGRLSGRLRGGIVAGETRSTTIAWQARPGTDISVRVDVDPWGASSVPESDESNNSLTVRSALDVPAPDLRVAGITYTPPTDIEDEDAVTFDITVENAGTGRAVESVVQLAVGSDRMSVRVPPIAGGGSETVTAVWRARVGTNVSVSATADAPNRLVESDETNNGRNAGEIPAVDPLERFFPAVTPGERTVPPGTTTQYAVTIVNNGSADAAYEVDVSGVDASWYRLDTREVFLGAGERAEIPLTVAPPADCSLNATHRVEATVSSLDTGATKRASADLDVDPRPNVLDLQPTNGTEVGTAAPTITWRTRANTTGRVYVREVGMSNWSVFEGSNATLHAVALANLTREAWHEFYVESSNDCATTTSEPRRVFVDDGVFFTSGDSSVDVERDYNQKHTFHVKNTDDEPHDVVVNVQNPHDDVIVGFVGAGSVDEPLRLEPGERAPVGLRIHTQDARREHYDLVVNLTTLNGTTAGGQATTDAAGSGPIGTSHAAVRVNVDVPEFNLSVERVASDDATLARTYRVTNHGDTLTDFAVSALGSNKTRVLFDPAFSHGLLRSGESVTFVARPLLHEGGTGFNATLRFGAAGEHVDQTVDFRAPAGEKVFTARYPPTEVEFGPRFDGDGSNATNPANGSTVAPVLANGTRVFTGQVQAKVWQRGVTVAGEDVSLILSDGSERTVVPGRTDLAGRATFRITLSPGTYTYRVAVDGMGAITEGREFTVNETADVAYDIGVDWERIADENSTYDGTADGVVLDNATYRVEASAPRAPADATPVLVLQHETIPQWIQTVTGTLNGETVTFDASAISPGNYTARIMLRSESRVVLSDPRNLTFTDTNPRNFENQTTMSVLDPDNDLVPNEQLIRTRIAERDAAGKRKSIRFLDVEPCVCRPIPAEFRPNVSSTDPTGFDFQYRYVYAITATERMNDTLLVRVRDENGNLTYQRRQDFTVGPNETVLVSVPVSVPNSGTPLHPALPEENSTINDYTIEIITVDFVNSKTAFGETLKFFGASETTARVGANIGHCAVGLNPLAGGIVGAIDTADAIYEFATGPDAGTGGSVMKATGGQLLGEAAGQVEQYEDAAELANLPKGALTTPLERAGAVADKFLPALDCAQDAYDIYQAINSDGPGENGSGSKGDGGILSRVAEDWRCTNRPIVTQPIQGPWGTLDSGGPDSPPIVVASDGVSTSAPAGTDQFTERETAADIANASTDGVEAITFENRFGEFWGGGNSVGPFDTIYRWNGERIGALTNEVPVGPYQFRIDDPRPGFVRRSGEGGTATNHFTIVTRGMNPGHYAQNTETTVNFFLERRTMRVVARNRTEADRLFAEHVNETTAERRPDAVIPRRDLVVSDTDPEPGDTVTVSATVHNFGTDYVSKAQIRFLVDGTEIGETPVYFMRPGATRTREIEYTVPTSDPGTLNVTAVVDPDDRMAEEDETNNRANGTISVGRSGPTAAFKVATARPTVGQAVRFDASASSAPGGTIASYAWDFDGDGAADANGSVVSHSFDVAGDHPVTLTITDQDGTTALTTRTVTVRLPAGVDDFGNTTAPNASRTTPSELADELRVGSAVAANASIERTANRSGNYSLSIAVDGNATNVTVYLNASRVEAALGGLDGVRLLVDGRERPFWIARAGGERWLAFVVGDFSTRRVTFTTSCIDRAVAGDDRTIGLAEIQRAITWWAEDTVVPNTGGETISLAEIQDLINAWAGDEAVSC